ncbi:Uncharacterized protein HZ326_0516 [Fusarium oxysporum f. sp. albedinis]|nr:Uncharacterized protein HZ326_0516 [Fusarium oxysporum f. sp. albedinis]
MRKSSAVAYPSVMKNARNPQVNTKRPRHALILRSVLRHQYFLYHDLSPKSCASLGGLLFMSFQSIRA